MDTKKAVAGVIAVLLLIGGAIWQFDLKGAVCGSSVVSTQSK